MQRKFKLIKCYPSSPTLNTIITIESLQETGYYSENKEFWQEIIEIPVGTKVVDTNPETKGYTYEKLPDGHWKIGNMDFITIDENSIGKNKRFQIVEEIKKDYEILSFQGLTSGKLIWTKQKNKLFSVSCSLNKLGTHSEEYLLQEGLKINSVKRLSDGEVFTVGDKVQTSMILTINSFIIINNELLINPFEIIGTVALNKITKAKQPLFTTEDGVDIFEGDIFYIAYEHKDLDATPCKANKHHGKLLCKTFSTYEKAQEYILMNKPCLSINDLIKHSEIKIKAVDVPRLKELVKSKL
jgi:hypothetical protein